MLLDVSAEERVNQLKRQDPDLKESDVYIFCLNRVGQRDRYSVWINDHKYHPLYQILGVNDLKKLKEAGSSTVRVEYQDYVILSHS